MTLTVPTADEMAEHERRVALGRPWPLISVVWFERAKQWERDRRPVSIVDAVAASKPPDLALWLALARFFKRFR